MSSNKNGIFSFLIIWVGQIFSLIGTAMTSFAFSIWVFKTTGEVTPLAIVGFLNFGCIIAFSPLAGAITDRYNRKIIMIIADCFAGLATILLFILLSLNILEIWHLYISAAIAGTSNAFHMTSYSTSITMLLPKKHFSRGASLVAMAEPGSQILAPIFAGALLGFVDIKGILIVDIVTFIFAIITLLFVKIPQPEVSKEGENSKGSLFKESIFGMKYIFRNPSLLIMTASIFIKNLLDSFTMVVQGPYILSRTNNNESIMAFILSLEAIGGVTAGFILSLWGGFKKKSNGILIGIAVGGLFLITMALGEQPIVWFISAFCLGFHVPIIVNSYKTILMTKVSPDIQGKVFSSARFLSAISLPLSMLYSGPLIDKVLNPVMKSDNAVSKFFASIIGEGMWSGISLLYLSAGLLCIVLFAIGLFNKSFRNADKILEDFDLKDDESITA